MIEINTREWKFVGLLGLVVAVITFLPMFVGLAVTPGDSVFLGTQTINPEDTPIYYSWIEQAKEGHLLFKNLYTTEDQTRYIFDPFWLGVGLFAKTFSLSSFAAYQLARVFLIAIFLAVSYIFISYFFDEEKKRKLCFIFLIFSSGLGGLVSLGAMFGSFNLWPPPMDLWVSESTTFYTLYHSPHLIASLTLMLLIFLLILRSFEKRKILYSLLAGLAALFLFQFHPYYVPAVFGIIGAYVAVQSLRSSKIGWETLKHYLILIAVSSPAIFYHLWTLNSFWSRQQHALQNHLATPPFYNVLITFGLLFALALAGVVYFLRQKQKSDKSIFLLTWLGTEFLLIYFPLINYQRKMVEGLHVAIVIAAVFGFFYLQKIFTEKNWRLKIFFQKNAAAILFFVLFFTFSDYSVLMRDLNYYLNPNSAAFLKKDKAEAMFWLKKNTPEESVVFATYSNGNLIPAFAVRPVYWGHWGMTADAKRKAMNKDLFFKTENYNVRMVFLKTNKISYLFWGPEEKSATNFNPDTADYLKKVYQNNAAAIYEVTNK